MEGLFILDINVLTIRKGNLKMKQRVKRINIRISTEEREMITELCKHHNTTISNLLLGIVRIKYRQMKRSLTIGE